MKVATLLVTVACTLSLSGCLATSGGGVFDLINDLNETSSKIMGTYQAPTLAASPTPSGCASHDQRCLILDQTEATLYAQARSNSLSWRQLVERFYAERQRQYPNTNDNSGAFEILAYQRVLADQMDRGKISETQWAYFIDQKWREIQTRNQQNAANAAIVRQQQKLQAPVDPTKCWTTRNGNSYYTTCN